MRRVQRMAPGWPGIIVAARESAAALQLSSSALLSPGVTTVPSRRVMYSWSPLVPMRWTSLPVVSRSASHTSIATT